MEKFNLLSYTETEKMLKNPDLSKSQKMFIYAEMLDKLRTLEKQKEESPRLYNLFFKVRPGEEMSEFDYIMLQYNKLDLW